MGFKQATVTIGFFVSGLVGCESQREEPTSVVASAMVPACENGFFQQVNLVSDEPGVASLQDVTLIKGWGISVSPTGGAFSVSSNATGNIELYTGDVNGSAIVNNLTISIPGGAPTGQVRNTSTDFVISDGVRSAPALILFATQTGTIGGWNPTVTQPQLDRALLAATVPGAVYTGLAIASTGTGNFLYAVDYQNGKIDVFNAAFQLVSLAGSFNDPDIHGKYHPFNIQNLGGLLYVTYAVHKKHSADVPKNGAGFVNVFDGNGNLVQRLASGHPLKAPWALALAPTDFGPFGGALLVGNFVDGRVNAYDPATGNFLGSLRDDACKPISVDGLLGFAFGNGLTAGDANALYFAAASDGLAHGLFGSIRFSAQP